MTLGLLVLRVVVGVFFVGHGAQKLWGSFGGHGPAGTAQFFETLGMRPGRRHAYAAGLAEAGGGTLLILGFLTPLAACAITAVMVVAIITVHGRNGPWSTDGGYEYNAVLMAAVFALAAVGAGSISIDHAIGWNMAGAGWALGELAVGFLGGYMAFMSGQRSTSREATLAGRGVRSAMPATEPRFERPAGDDTAPVGGAPLEPTPVDRRPR